MKKVFPYTFDSCHYLGSSAVIELVFFSSILIEPNLVCLLGKRPRHWRPVAKEVGNWDDGLCRDRHRWQAQDGNIVR